MWQAERSGGRLAKLMEFLQPVSLAEALAAKTATPEVVPIAGGTDVMVELNFARRRPEVLLDLNRVPELTGWTLQDGKLRVGAGVTYAELTGERAGAGSGSGSGAGVGGGASVGAESLGG